MPWDYGVAEPRRRPLRTALTALGLALVVFLLLLVVGFVRGLELSLQQSGDPEVVLLHNANAAENLENSSISDEVPTLARTEFAAHLVRYGDTAAVSPELTIASRVGGGTPAARPARRLPRRGLGPRVPRPPTGGTGRGDAAGPGEVLVGRLVAGEARASRPRTWRSGGRSRSRAGRGG